MENTKMLFDDAENLEEGVTDGEVVEKEEEEEEEEETPEEATPVEE